MEAAATMPVLYRMACDTSKLTSLFDLESFQNGLGLLPGIFNVMEVCHPETFISNYSVSGHL